MRPHELARLDFLFQQAQCLTRVGVRNAAGNNAELSIFTLGEHGVECVEFALGKIVGNGSQAFVDFLVRSVGALRENNPTRIALEAFGRARLRMLGHLEVGGGMAYARSGAHQHGGLIFLGQVVGGAHHLASLFGRCRVEHRHLGEGRKATCVLLGLGRNGAWVVGHVQNGAAFHAHIVQRHQGIAGNV